MKNKLTALLLSILVGGLGIDRFYLGYTGLGVLKLLTAGCFGVLWIIDIINIATGKLKPADGSEYEDVVAAQNQQRQNQYYETSNRAPSNAFDDLEKVSKLHEEGVLSDEEFDRMKSTILERI